MSILKFALFTGADKQFKIQNSKRQNLIVPGFLATFKMYSKRQKAPGQKAEL
jgi:hypothetical protein